MKSPSDPNGSDPNGSDPNGSKTPALKLDPVVAELARRVKASSLPKARDLVPLSAAQRHALTDKLLGPEEDTADPEAKGGGQEATELDSMVHQAPPAPPARSPALHLVPSPEKKKPRAVRWWPVALAATLGLVVAAFLWLRAPPPPGRVAYDLRAEGDRRVRGDTPPSPETPLQLRPSTRLLVVLSPHAPVPDASLRMLVVRDGRARIVRPPYENDGLGKLTIDKAARDALGDQENGLAELVWIAGRPMPEDAEVERIALDPGAEAPPGAVVLRRKAVFVDWGGALRMVPENIEFAGCKAMIRGPECEVEAGGKLVLWAPFEAREGHVGADGREAQVEAIAAAGGTRWTVTVAGGTREIELTSERLSAPFRLSITAAPNVPAISEASALVEQNKLSEAEKILDTVKDDSSYARVATVRQRARIARRQGDMEKAASLFRAAVSMASEAGRLSDEIECRHVLALDAMGRRRDHAAAKKDLDAARPLEEQCRQWQPDGAYYRGALAVERGWYGDALTDLTTARQTAARLGLSDLERNALQPLAEMLSLWGRDEEAVDLLRRAHALSPDTPCERAEALTNWAWGEYRAAGTKTGYERAASRADEAIRVLAGSACASVLATAQMNAGLAQAAAGRTSDARRTLDRVREAASGDARLAPWIARMELDLDRAEDPARALSTAARLEREMQQNTLPELAFEAALGRAAALDALGRPEEASAAYEEAAAREIAWVAAAPLGEGRALFFERQRSAFRAWINLAVRRAEQADTSPEAQRAAALEVARVVRRSLGRFFATLLVDSAESAGAPAAPPAPAKGEVHLYYHPIREGWVAVAVSAQGRSAVKRFRDLPGSSPEGRDEALLSPVEEVLVDAKRVVIFADRALRDVDFEDLPWKGGVLSDRATVVYGTGTLAGAASPVPVADACASRPFALLVVNPSLNLAGAERAGKYIAGRLGPGATLLAGELATREAVMAALGDPCIRLFEYDGHAVLGEKKDGIEAALSLADGPLTTSMLRDREKLLRVPDVVVLSGCETAREEGLGVAHAFLERGSRQVLATTAKVDDAQSARLMEALYRQDPPAGPGWDVAAALRAAVLSLRGRGVGAGPWAPFRVLVP